MHARLFGCAAGAGTITLDGTSLSIEDAWKIAAGEADVAIAPEAVKLLEDIHKLVMASTAKVPYVKADRIFTDDIRAGVDLLKNYRF